MRMKLIFFLIYKNSIFKSFCIGYANVAICQWFIMELTWQVCIHPSLIDGYYKISLLLSFDRFLKCQRSQK